MDLKEEFNKLITRGEIIIKKESPDLVTDGILLEPYIPCEESRLWINGIAIFNERYLSNHPLFTKIKEYCDDKKDSVSECEILLSLLKSVRDDDEFFFDENNKSSTKFAGDFDSQRFIFISHRTTDKNIAEILVDFLVGAGISKKHIFCSSLPGNDVKEIISKEVKQAIISSVLNIVILSIDYYKSAY